MTFGIRRTGYKQDKLLCLFSQKLCGLALQQITMDGSRYARINGKNK
jgi:hypothetical protein